MRNRSNTTKAGNATAEQKLSDEVLVARVAQGDSSALEALYDRYSARVLGITMRIHDDRMVAEDLLQETYWRVWRYANTFRPELGSFAAWLFRIARNLAVDAYRKRRGLPLDLSSFSSDEMHRADRADAAGDVPEQVQAVFTQRQVREALASLPEAQQQVIELAFYHGMTRQEIAEATGEALGTVHTRARLALQKLRQILEKPELEG